MKFPIPIRVSTAPDGFRFVGVGESGRGRRLVKVPLGRAFPDVDEVSAADISSTSSGSPVLVPEQDKDDSRAVVLIRDRSGFRGSWSLSCGVLPPRRADASVEDDERRLALLEIAHQTPKRPTGPGPAWFKAGDGRVAVVAEGRCAQGAAGRMGGGSEYLIVMEPGAALTISRWGRLGGAPGRLILEWDGVALAESSWEDYSVRLAAAGPTQGVW